MLTYNKYIPLSIILHLNPYFNFKNLKSTRLSQVANKRPHHFSASVI